MKTDLKV